MLALIHRSCHDVFLHVFVCVCVCKCVRVCLLRVCVVENVDDAFMPSRIHIVFNSQLFDAEFTFLPV